MTEKRNLYALVGAKHRGAEALVALLPPDEPLILVREPDNKYDSNAIQVWARGRHVGYVSKDQNKILAAFIDQNGKLWQAPSHIAGDELPAHPHATAVTSRALDAKLHKGSNQWPLVEVA